MQNKREIGVFGLGAMGRNIADGLPANLIQLQREYFGSHGFERIWELGQLYHFSEDYDI